MVKLAIGGKTFTRRESPSMRCERDIERYDPRQCPWSTVLDGPPYALPEMV